MSCLYIFKCPHGKTLNFLHQCELCAKDHLAERAETIQTQQSTIDRLTEQRDRLLQGVKVFMQHYVDGEPCYEHLDNGDFGQYIGNSVYLEDTDFVKINALIAEIEAGK